MWKGRPSGLRGYAIVSVGQAISLLGSGLTNFALGVWVFQHTSSVSLFLLVGFFSRVPELLASPVVGTLVDRVDRRKAIILADLGTGAGTLALALLFLFDRIEFWNICAIVAVQAALGATHFPAFSALTSQMVPTEDLSRASGLRELVRSSAFLLAPLIAGVLLDLIGIGWILLLDVVSIVPGIVSLMLVDVRERDRPRAPPAPGRLLTSFWNDTREGWLFLRARGGLLGLLGLFALVNFIFISVQSLLTPLVLSFASPQVLGVVMTVAGFGLVTGSGFMVLWAGPRNRIVLILALLGVQGVSLLFGGLRPEALLVAAAAFLFISLQPVMNTCSQTLWLRKVHSEVQGRVFALRRMVVGSTIPIAYLTMGPLADHVFEPLMAPDGFLADSVGRVIGTGEGRGIGLMLGLMGLLQLILALLASTYRSLRNLEDDLPDPPRPDSRGDREASAP